MSRTLELCCRLCNAVLEERIWAHKSKVSTGCSANTGKLKSLKQALPEYKKAYSRVLEDVPSRLDKSFQGFFRRVRKKTRAGFPGFKPIQRYHSFIYPQSGFRLLPNGRTWASKTWELRVSIHREPKGKVKTLIIKRDCVADGFL